MKQIKKFQIGKKGLTDEFIKQIKNSFEKDKRSEIVKVDILKSACRNKKEAKKIGDLVVEKLGKNYDYVLVGYVLTIRKFRKNIR